MKKKASFSISKAIFLEALVHLSKVFETTEMYYSSLEITVVKNKVKLVITGVEIELKAQTSGTVKFTQELLYFKDVVKKTKDKILNFNIESNYLQLGNVSVSIKTTFFKEDNSLRDIRLPIVYNDQDIVRLELSNRYTPEELEFNNLDKYVSNSFTKVSSDIEKISKMLKKYDITREELEQFILHKMNLNN